MSLPLPDPSADPLGFSLVQEFMIYGPCGSADLNSPCMRDGECSKRYPKPFRSEIAFDEAGQLAIHYTGTERKNGILTWKGNVQADNQWVLRLFHIIYQYSRNTRHILMLRNRSDQVYLFKYVNKGFDCSWNEVQESSLIFFRI